MVDDELTDGVRIGQLLSSEIHGHERESLGRLAVVDAEPDLEPSTEGTFAFAVAFDADDAASASDTLERIARVFVHPDHVRVEFTATTGTSTAAEAASDEGLRAEAVGAAAAADATDESQRTLVHVQNGAEVKPALRVVRRVADDIREDAA